MPAVPTLPSFTMLTGGAAQLATGLLSIILIDLALSGDNALVIGLAARRLPRHQRRVAIIGGAGLAILLRASLTVVAALLLRLPYVQLAGGVLLCWIAIKLLGDEEAASGNREANTLWSALLTIVMADAVMSLDNVVGVAAAAHGNSGLLVLGLVLSMGLMIFGGTLVASLLARWWWLAYLAAAIIAWTGADLVLRDPTIDALLPLDGWLESAVPVVGAAVVLLVAQRLRHPSPAPTGRLQ